MKSITPEPATPETDSIRAIELPDDSEVSLSLLELVSMLAAGPMDTNWLVNFLGKYADELQCSARNRAYLFNDERGQSALDRNRSDDRYDRGLTQD